MKITFVYPDVQPHVFDWTGYFYDGIASLSAVSKRDGHTTSLIHITQPISKSDFVERVQKEDPDLIGFSSTSHTLPVVKKLASWLVESKVEVPTICGGIHPTIAPEESIGIEGMSMICRGEGEAALSELCQKLTRKEDISSIRNLWIKRNSTIIKNPLRPILDDLDKLPFPDRGIFDYQNLHNEREGRGTFMVSRGCPYKCTYCCNHLLREIYGSKGKSIRFRSVESVIAEIKQVVDHYPFIESLVFDDDILFLHRKWSEEFAEEYSRQINLPFECHARADVTDETLTELLKKAGCVHIKFGLESGNKEIRYKVLNRRMTNEQIKKAFVMSKKAGMVTESYNMVGIPYETPSNVLDTIKLTATIGIDIMQAMIYQPYQGTKLAELCREQGFLKSGGFGADFFSPSIVKLDTMSPAQVLMFRDYFIALVRYYQVLQRLPGGVSKFAIWLSDRILSFAAVARVLNLVYTPLHYLYSRRKALKLRKKVARRNVRESSSLSADKTGNL